MHILNLYMFFVYFIAVRTLRMVDVSRAHHAAHKRPREHLSVPVCAVGVARRGPLMNRSDSI